jgi:serine/threonine protein kinase
MAGLEGKQLGDCEIVAKLGQGGMGAVYKARQTALDRMVAIKVLPAQFSTDDEFIARFKREAAAAARLTHPNIVQVYSAGKQEDTNYFVMEFVDGESVQQRLKRKGKIAPAEALAICVYVAQGLDYAWKRTKLIHRDIKPDNIFLSTDGEVKLGDLGLAKSAGGPGSGLTMTGAYMGTPYFVSPEQARGLKEIDFRADIYSLGCTLYFMVSGHMPYEGEGCDALQLMFKHVNEPPPEILQVWPECPAPLAELITAMIQKKPDDRYQSYEELIAHMKQVVAELRSGSQAQVVVHKKAVSEAAEALPITPVLAATLPAAPVPAPASAVSKKTPQPKSISPAKVDKTQLVESVPPAEPNTPAKKAELKAPSFALIMTGTVVSSLLVLGLFLWSPWKPSRSSVTPVTQPVLAGVDVAFIKEIAALPAEEQVKRVVVKLKELNPLFDPAADEWQPIIKNGQVTELSVFVRNIADVSPLAAFTKLQAIKFKTEGNRGRSKLSDLSPLRGLPLTRLECKFTRITNLSPLQGMSLTELTLVGSPFKALSPLRGMPLKDLRLAYCEVTDLSPLADLSLDYLEIQRTKVTDVSPIRNYRIKSLACDSSLDLSPLRGNSTLERINVTGKGIPVAEYWKRVDAGEFPTKKPLIDDVDSSATQNASAGGADAAFVKEVAALPAEEQVKRVVAELKKLNPGPEGWETHEILGGQVISFKCSSESIKDISPLRTLPHLTTLWVKGTKDKRNPLTDLSPLRGMKLTQLAISKTQVRELSPLNGMPMEFLDAEQTQVTDLTPLRGMPMRSLNISRTPVTDISPLRDLTKLDELFMHTTAVADLSPLKGLRLKQLACQITQVNDLSPLQGMSLKILGCGTTKVNDLSPLQNLPLESLSCDFKPERDTKILRSIKTLTTINNKPAAEFWKQVDAGTTPAATEQPRQTIDLLALTDPVKDRVWSVGGASPTKANRWARRDGALVYESDGYSGKLAPPVAINARSYELEVGYERLSGTGRLHVDFPFEGKKIIPVYLDAPGFKVINMKAGQNWPSGKGQQGRGIIRLDRSADGVSDHITVRLNSEVLLDWTGDLRTVLHANGEPHPGFPGQPVTSLYSHKDSYKINAWTLRIFDGEAKVLREPTGEKLEQDTWQNAINLLPLIDPKRDAVRGNWTREQESLVGDRPGQNGCATIEIPYRPPAEYDFRIEFTVQRGGNVGAQHLAKAGQSFTWNFYGGGGRMFGFESVRGEPLTVGRGVSSNLTVKVRGSGAIVGQRYTSTVEVRDGEVRAFLDGELITAWKTDYSDLKTLSYWRLRDETLLGIGCETRVVFHGIRVREVTGKGTFTRSAPLPTNSGVQIRRD